MRFRLWNKSSLSQKAHVEMNRENCGRKNKAVQVGTFLQFVLFAFIKFHWSLDVCFGFALKTELFTRENMVCTKTLYNYVNLGLLGKIRNIDLPLKVRRKNKWQRVRKYKKKLGGSIEERSALVDEGKEFGHWECDLVIGTRDKGEVLLTLTERKTRYSFILKLPDKKASTVLKAFNELFTAFVSDADKVFKSLTSDNGSEFASLSELEKVSNILVYYAHPYTSWEKGSIENHNGLFRRFIPKGKNISNYSLEYVARVARWANTLSRKILGYATAEEIFVKEFSYVLKR